MDETVEREPVTTSLLVSSGERLHVRLSSTQVAEAIEQAQGAFVELAGTTIAKSAVVAFGLPA